MATTPQKFGGPWSLIKVDTVAQYYSAFNTALKNRGFKRVCIDAFAGSGDFQYRPHDASPLFDEAEVVEQVRITVVHEVAHHFGIDDDRLDELGWA